MLYPRNDSARLDPALFQQPTSEYRGAPFWAWNTQLEERELLCQLEVFKQMGLGGAHMHVRTGMATPYLSDAFFSLIKTCTEKCKVEDMLAWLYDEDRWPSGAAGGIVTREVKYRAKHLLFTTVPYDGTVVQESLIRSGGGARSNQGELLACYDIVLDDNGCLQKACRISPAAPVEGSKWYAYAEPNPSNPWFNGQTYVDTLNPEAIAHFIEVTYERYHAAVGHEFGKTIPAIFTDEPQFTRKGHLGFAHEQKDVLLPWTDDFPASFRSAYGEDILARLPELIWELPERRISTLRYRYHDHIAERFAAAFADQCGQWCEDHGLMLTGHMMEEPTLESQCAALGDAMRSYRSFQLPGIDMLAGRRELTTAKQAQSAVRQYGRPGMLSELYGVTGWTFDFRSHKLHGDWQAALGVTVRVPHLSWVSMKGEAKRDYPASINYQSPWWQDYAVVEDHFARLNTALTRGQPIVHVGVIHPVESYWLHWGPAEQTHAARQQLETQFQEITKWLLLGGIDFDFISEALLPSQCKHAAAPMQVGQMAYDVILVPGCETLRSSTLQRLSDFHAAGGQLIFLGDAPVYEDALPSGRGAALYQEALHLPFTKEALLDALQPVRTVDLRNADGSRTENLLHQLRCDGEDRWLFIAQGEEPYNKDIPQQQDVQITVTGEYHVRLYDTLTGEICPIRYDMQPGRTVIRASLFAHDSLLLNLSHTAADQPVPMNKANPRRLDLPDLVPYSLSEPNALLLDHAEYALDAGPWQPVEELLRADNLLRRQLNWPSRQGAVTQPWCIPDEPAAHRVRLRFTIFADQSFAKPRLALEDAEAAYISLNGTCVASVPDGWFVDHCIQTIPLPPLSVGTNQLEISLPFTKRDGLEWCYLLGDFGVELRGVHRSLTSRHTELGFSDWTNQRLVHYTGNLTYHIPLHHTTPHLRITVPHYAGAAIRVALDGHYVGHIIYAPYELELTSKPGLHELQLTVLGHRENAFGPLHNADANKTWIGPNQWRTSGALWTECYRLAPMGLLSSPIIEEW